MSCQLQNGFESRPVRHFSCSIRLSALFFDIHTQIHTHKFCLALASKLLLLYSSTWVFSVEPA